MTGTISCRETIKKALAPYLCLLAHWLDTTHNESGLLKISLDCWENVTLYHIFGKQFGMMC